MDENTNNNPSADEVQDYLDKLATTPIDEPIHDPKGMQETEHVHVADFSDEAEEKKVEEKKVDAEDLRDTTFDEMEDEEEKLRKEDLKRIMENVKVTDSEKAAYLRATLHDIPVELTIRVAGAIDVKIRARTALEHQLVFEATERDIAEGIVQFDRINYHNQTQKYGALFMLREIGGKPFNSYSANTNGAPLTKEFIDQQVGVMRNLKANLIDNMSQPRLGLLLDALRLFEAKMAIMASEVVNENFWKAED